MYKNPSLATTALSVVLLGFATYFFGEYVISRPMDGIAQLALFALYAGLLIIVGNIVVAYVKNFNLSVTKIEDEVEIEIIVEDEKPVTEERVVSEGTISEERPVSEPVKKPRRRPAAKKTEVAPAAEKPKAVKKPAAKKPAPKKAEAKPVAEKPKAPRKPRVKKEKEIKPEK